MRKSRSTPAKAHYAEHAEGPSSANWSISSPPAPLVALVRRVTAPSRRSVRWRGGPPVKRCPARSAVTRLQFAQNIVQGPDSPESAEREIKDLLP